MEMTLCEYLKVYWDCTCKEFFLCKKGGESMIKVRKFLLLLVRILGSLLLAIFQIALIPLVFMLVISSIDQSMNWLGLNLVEDWFGIKIEEQKWRLLVLFLFLCAVYILFLKLIAMGKRNLLSKEIHFFWSMKKISIKNPFYSEYLAAKDRQQKELLMEEEAKNKILGLEKINEELKQHIINLKNKYQYPVSMINSVMRIIYWITEAIKSPEKERHKYNQLLDHILAELNNTEVLRGIITQAAIYVKEGDMLSVHGNFCLEHHQVEKHIQPNEGFEGSIFAQNQTIAILDINELKHDYTINRSQFKSIIGYPFGRNRRNEPDAMIVLYLSAPPSELDVVYTNIMLYAELINCIIELKGFSGIIKERKEV